MKRLLAFVLSFFFTLPVFMLVYPRIPSIEIPVGTGIRLDQMILFMFIFLLLYFLIYSLKKYYLYISITLVLAIGLSHFTGLYSLQRFSADYLSLLTNLEKVSESSKFVTKTVPFTREELLREAIDYNNPELIDFARNIATKHFQEYKALSKDSRWIQYFSIFKEIENKWIYMYDPLYEEFFSKASNTAKQLSYNNKFKGDCDDYSIIIAACIRAVGGEVRLVRTNVLLDDGRTVGHLYPEVKIGDKKDFENVAYLLRNLLFPKEIKNKPLRYFLDNKGEVWLNFDYNDHFPGGRYQSNIRISELKV
ncbi:hypothetical protein [Lishizhenia tianjinensis]|nr:hypothetical protein [Lishizhenia tianjinensis]